MKSGIMQEMDRLCCITERRIEWLEQRVRELEAENSKLVAAYVQAADRASNQTINLALAGLLNETSTGGHK